MMGRDNSIPEMRLTFGDFIENGWAGDANPLKRGFFVRRAVRKGRFNAGPYAVFTDGNGRFWEHSLRGECKLRRLKCSSAFSDTNILPPDVTRLVIAARRVAFGDDRREALGELDKASEAFADRVPWENEPEDDEA